MVQRFFFVFYSIFCVLSHFCFLFFRPARGRASYRRARRGSPPCAASRFLRPSVRSARPCEQSRRRAPRRTGARKGGDVREGSAPMPSRVFFPAVAPKRARTFSCSDSISLGIFPGYIRILTGYTSRHESRVAIGGSRVTRCGDDEMKAKAPHGRSETSACSPIEFGAIASHGREKKKRRRGLCVHASERSRRAPGRIATATVAFRVNGSDGALRPSLSPPPSPRILFLSVASLATSGPALHGGGLARGGDEGLAEVGQRSELGFPCAAEAPLGVVVRALEAASAPEKRRSICAAVAKGGDGRIAARAGLAGARVQLRRGREAAGVAPAAGGVEVGVEGAEVQQLDEVLAPSRVRQQQRCSGSQLREERAERRAAERGRGKGAEVGRRRVRRRPIAPRPRQREWGGGRGARRRWGGESGRGRGARRPSGRRRGCRCRWRRGSGRGGGRCRGRQRRSGRR